MIYSRCSATDPAAVEEALSPFFESIHLHKAVHSNADRTRLQENLGTLIPS